MNSMKGNTEEHINLNISGCGIGSTRWFSQWWIWLLLWPAFYSDQFLQYRELKSAKGESAKEPSPELTNENTNKKISSIPDWSDDGPAATVMILERNNAMGKQRMPPTRVETGDGELLI